MNDIHIKDSLLRQAAMHSVPEFMHTIVEALEAGLGGDATAADMGRLNTAQHTLLAYWIFRNEVLEGGFVQLIQNGFGPYIFQNPFARSMREIFGLREFSKMVYAAREIYDKNREDLERERTEEEFMSMYEQYEAFDDIEDEYIECEESITGEVARYVDSHLNDFVTVDKDENNL